jgi:hypothetical protein
MSSLLPEDIQPSWLNVIRRLQSVASTENRKSYAVLTIHILIDDTATPRLWSTPTCRVIEPKRSAGEILEILTGVFGDQHVP